MQKVREAGRTLFSPLDLLNKYKQHPTDTVDRQSIQEQPTQLEASGQQTFRTPSQQLADLFLEKYHFKMFAPVIKRFMPSLDIAEVLVEVDDAEKWHNSLKSIKTIIEKVLQEDIDGGYIKLNSTPQSTEGAISDGPTYPTETSEDGWISSSTESLPSGNDGLREEHIDVSTDAEVHEQVLNFEVKSPVPDSGHETQVQGHVGTKWPDDLDDW
jgi:hypothetical protein